jgi:uncharacterized protein (TIGR03435 family)
MLFVIFLVLMQTTRFIEVASIRERPDEFGVMQFEFQPRRLTIANRPLRDLVADAYGLNTILSRERLIEGWPSQSLPDQRFDISAVLTQERVSTVEQRQVLMELLTTRFGLKAHIERRPMDVYQLTLATPGTLGRGLKKVTVDCAKEPQKDPMTCRGMTNTWRGSGDIARLMFMLEPTVKRFVVDRTGLQGFYEWDMPMPRLRESREAIMREHLGLVLVPARATMDVVVIDALHAPTPN